MTTTELIGTPATPHGVDVDGSPDPSDAGERPAYAERSGEIGCLIGAVPVEGPPLILIAAPLVLFALLLTGPFVVVLTLAVLLAACAALVAVAGALVASPYLLVRRLGRHRLLRANRNEPAGQFGPAQTRREPA